MKLRQALVVQLAALAAAGVSCSKSSQEPGLRPSASRDAEVPSEAAVMQAMVRMPNGESCNANVDGDCRECLVTKGGKEIADSCEALQGNAKAGAAAGTPRARLCREALDCIRRTSCHSNSLVECYCGKITLGECNATTDAKGACKNELDRALEIRPGSAGIAALDNMTEPSMAGGVAGMIATAENTGCPSACIPYKATSCP